MRITTLVCGLIGLAAICQDSNADAADTLLLGGTEVSADNTYIYLGRVTSLSESLGNGAALRLWADWSRYRYDKDGLTREVSAPGAQIALGYQGARNNYWWGAYASAGFRRSSISPDDPGSPVRGSRLRPALQLEGEQTLQQVWKLGANGSYVFGQRAHWVRGRVSHRIGSSLQLGLEAIAQGDPDYRAHQFGVVLLGLKLGKSIDAGLKLGTRQVENLESQAYFGVELGSLY